MAYDYLVAVGAHVKDDTVYRIAKAMYENKLKLAESLRAFNGFDPDNMHKTMPAGFHPGAVKFYKEKGIGGGREGEGGEGISPPPPPPRGGGGGGGTPRAGRGRPWGGGGGGGARPRAGVGG